MVFDEIDAGIGGTTAHAVAETLRRLAERAQVVTITHLPQIATVADRHFRVEKVPGDPTHTRIEPLDDAQRRDELERMLGGAEFLAVARRDDRSLARAARARARTSGGSSPSRTTCPTGGRGSRASSPTCGASRRARAGRCTATKRNIFTGRRDVETMRADPRDRAVRALDVAPARAGDRRRGAPPRLGAMTGRVVHGRRSVAATRRSRSSGSTTSCRRPPTL